MDSSASFPKPARSMPLQAAGRISAARSSEIVTWHAPHVGGVALLSGDRAVTGDMVRSPGPQKKLAKYEGMGVSALESRAHKDILNKHAWEACMLSDGAGDLTCEVTVRDDSAHSEKLMTSHLEDG